MCVCDLEHANGDYVAEVDAATSQPWYRIVGDLEEQAVGAVEINGELLVLVTYQLVAPRLGERVELSEVRSGGKLVQAAKHLVCALRSQLSDSLRCGGAHLGELGVAKANVHALASKEMIHPSGVLNCFMHQQGALDSRDHFSWSADNAPHGAENRYAP